LTHRPAEDWQLADWEWTDAHGPECCILRSRGGSKTKDFVDWLIIRVLCKHEIWGWLSAKSGQLSQALLYFSDSPFFVKKHQIQNKEYIQLCDGSEILFGIISRSNLGARLDGYILDELEDMEPKQSTEVFPQMAGMLIDSPIAKRVYLGTRWIGTMFDDLCDKLPCSTHDYTYSPQINAAFMANEIRTRPAWEINLLYRCLRSAPSGMLFGHNLHIGPIPSTITATISGMDFGANDTVVCGPMPTNDRLYVTDEYQLDVEAHPEGLYPLRGLRVCCESGGYNEMDRYGNKCQTVQSILGAIGEAVTWQWKAARQQLARQIEIYIDPNRTPLLMKDLSVATYGPDGLYLKKDDKIHECHSLDAMFHLLGANQLPVYEKRSDTYTIAM
jgi:hypothetical protein